MLKKMFIAFARNFTIKYTLEFIEDLERKKKQRLQMFYYVRLPQLNEKKRNDALFDSGKRMKTVTERDQIFYIKKQTN